MQKIGFELVESGAEEMTLYDRATTEVIARLMTAADGALLGVGVGYVAYRCIRKYTATSSALRRVCDAPSVAASDIRSVLNDGCDGEKMIVVRGCVEAADKRNLKSFMENNPITVASMDCGEQYVIFERTQTCIYNEWRRFFGWTTNFAKPRSISTTRMVPFVLVDGEKSLNSDYLLVNMEGSHQPLPLKTVFLHVVPTDFFRYTFLQALFGFEYPVGMLYKERILPLREEVTAVGIAYTKNGNFEIKSCGDIPYFLSTLSKDEIVADLSSQSKMLIFSGLLLGTVAIGILGYSIKRNWSKWKAYRQRQQSDSSTATTNAVAAAEEEEESEEIPDGELCVICLTRRRRSCFVPCGHKVCCRWCALHVNSEASPKCPICSQSVTSSVRVYDS